jgi:small subunit ribosomal protein S6
LRDQERAPRKYELMTILHPEVEEESLPGELDRISGYIATAGGELIDSLRDSPWGRRRLAYPIRSGGRDVRDGYYTVWHFSIGPSRLDELERELKLNTQVIRYIVVSWEPKPIDPKEVEAAEIAAEEAAAAAYAAAQAAAAASEDAAAEAYAASEAAAAEAATAAAAEAAGEPVEAAAMGLVADTERTEELTAEAEAIEATGAELAIEPVAAVEEREELEVEAAAALEKAAEAAAAETTAEETEIPAGAIRGDESGECPDDYPVKGNTSSMLYHTPGSPSYKRTNPEFCFASVEAAEAAGFGPTKYEAAQEEGAQEEGE